MSSDLNDYDELKDLFENAPCGYLSMAPSGSISRANRTLESWLGYEPGGLAGKRVQQLLSGPGKIYYETHFAPLLRMQGFFHEVALDLVSATGATLPVLVNAQERRLEDGSVTFVRLTVFNATDRRRYERELVQAKAVADAASAKLRDLNATLEARVEEEVRERLKAEEGQRQMQKMESVGRLTGGIAHDFNNMIAVVTGALNLIERRLAQGRDVSELIAAAKDGARRAATLTHRLLSFARQAPLEARALSLNRVVSDISDLLQRTLGEHVQLETVLAGGLWSVRTDQSQLENTIVNLAVNARDAMPGGGKITIETSNAHLDDEYAIAHQEVNAGQYVLLAVSDTGSGMSQEVIDHAFEPFFTTKAVGKGTGLGLSQIFGYVKQSGGHIKIYSEVGHGTTIKVYLPRHYGDAEMPDAIVARETPTGSKSEVILLVEDDDRMREIASAMLEELGYTVLNCSNGRRALDLLASPSAVSLLFTDVVMPEMSGRALANEALAQRPGIKILFTTGYTRNAVVHNGVLDANINFLSKPYSLDQLARKVRAVLDARKQTSTA